MSLYKDNIATKPPMIKKTAEINRTVLQDGETVGDAGRGWVRKITFTSHDGKSRVKQEILAVKVKEADELDIIP